MPDDRVVDVTHDMGLAIREANLPVVVTTLEGPTVPLWVAVVSSACSAEYDGMNFAPCVLKLLQKPELIEAMMVIYDAFDHNEHVETAECFNAIHDFLAVRVFGRRVFVPPSRDG